ncbi:hypothetical protein [Terrihabitans sp. B22-R8]|uniref:hypothetical protein n=1 Tax=Terrihabitans sp. B22-R8 TaxID=3425128 RepID=UPI00403D21AF
MSYTDPNDPVARPRVDPNTPHTTTVNTASGSTGGMSWFIVAALVLGAGVLGYLYFGGNTDTASNEPAAIEAPAETGRAATTESAPAPASPAMPADNAPANAPSAPIQPDTPAQPDPGAPSSAPAQ